MSTPIIAFFDNKGGVGKTSLVYHLAWMFADLGVAVVAADLDPQANLSAAFLDEERLDALWPADSPHPGSVFGCLKPLISGTGDVASPQVEVIGEQLGLIVGDLALSTFEDDLSTQWPACLSANERAFRVISAFWRVIQAGARERDAKVVLLDVGPNRGAINRAALVAADFVVVPLSPDLFSLQGLRNLGPTLRLWREEWSERKPKNPQPQSLPVPSGSMEPIGYIVLQHALRLDRPVRAYEKWMARIPNEYRESVLGLKTKTRVAINDDPNCLAMLKHYRSLMPLAHEARKPMFHLRPADGALGAHLTAVGQTLVDFETLARKIAQKTKIRIP